MYAQSNSHSHELTYIQHVINVCNKSCIHNYFSRYIPSWMSHGKRLEREIKEETDSEITWEKKGKTHHLNNLALCGFVRVSPNKFS